MFTIKSANELCTSDLPRVENPDTADLFLHSLYPVERQELLEQLQSLQCFLVHVEVDQVFSPLFDATQLQSRAEVAALESQLANQIVVPPFQYLWEDKGLYGEGAVLTLEDLDRQAAEAKEQHRESLAKQLKLGAIRWQQLRHPVATPIKAYLDYSNLAVSTQAHYHIFEQEDGELNQIDSGSVELTAESATVALDWPARVNLEESELKDEQEQVFAPTYVFKVVADGQETNLSDPLVLTSTVKIELEGDDGELEDGIEIQLTTWEEEIITGHTEEHHVVFDEVPIGSMKIEVVDHRRAPARNQSGSHSVNANEQDAKGQQGESGQGPATDLTLTSLAWDQASVPVETQATATLHYQCSQATTLSYKVIETVNEHQIEMAQGELTLDPTKTQAQIEWPVAVDIPEEELQKEQQQYQPLYRIEVTSTSGVQIQSEHLTLTSDIQFEIPGGEGTVVTITDCTGQQYTETCVRDIVKFVNVPVGSIRIETK